MIKSCCWLLPQKIMIDLLPAAAEATPLMGKYFPSLNKTALNTSDIRPTKNWNQKKLINLQLQLVWLGMRWLIWWRSVSLSSKRLDSILLLIWKNKIWSRQKSVKNIQTKNEPTRIWINVSPMVSRYKKKQIKNKMLMFCKNQFL